MAKIYKEELAIDLADINAKFQGLPMVGDEVFVENCRLPGYSKNYAYNGVSWNYIELVDTSLVKKGIEQKKTCVCSAKHLLNEGDIYGAHRVLSKWLEGNLIESEAKPIDAKKISMYSAFVSKTLREVAKSHADKSPKDRMRLAMIMWKDHKQQLSNI